MTLFTIQNGNENLLLRPDILDERQMQGWRRKSVFNEPSPDRSKKMPVMKVEMRPVGEQFDAVVTRLPYGFQQVHRDRPGAMDLRGDSKFHSNIVGQM